MEWQKTFPPHPKPTANTRATLQPGGLNIKFIYSIPSRSLYTTMGSTAPPLLRLNFNCFTLQQLNTIPQLQRSAVCAEAVWKISRQPNSSPSFQCKVSFKKFSVRKSLLSVRRLNFCSSPLSGINLLVCEMERWMNRENPLISWIRQQSAHFYFAKKMLSISIWLNQCQTPPEASREKLCEKIFFNETIET